MTEVVQWDRNARLKRIMSDGSLTGPNKVIAKMWCYQYDLEVQMRMFAEWKTEYERLRARIVITKRQEGEKSADVAEAHAHLDGEAAQAHLNYRMAEQMISADKAALAVLHAELDAWQTQQADSRAADKFSAKEQV
jgi:hypothetical protein